MKKHLQFRPTKLCCDWFKDEKFTGSCIFNLDLLFEFGFGFGWILDLILEFVIWFWILDFEFAFLDWIWILYLNLDFLLEFGIFIWICISYWNLDLLNIWISYLDFLFVVGYFIWIWVSYLNLDFLFEFFFSRGKFNEWKPVNILLTCHSMKPTPYHTKYLMHINHESFLKTLAPANFLPGCTFYNYVIVFRLH